MIEAMRAMVPVSAIDALPAEFRRPEPGAPTTRTTAVDRYEIVGELGHGGMGVVYRAFDTVQNRVVALKTLRRTDPSTLYRFKQEFRALADVTHPNLVVLHELVSKGQDWYIAMEFVDGVNFLSYVRTTANVLDDTAAAPELAAPEFDQGQLPETEASDSPAGDNTHGAGTGHVDPSRKERGMSAYQVGRLTEALGQLAEGLIAVHEAGLLHRDIKPSNILITARGRVVLLDFGLAIAMEAPGLHESPEPHVLGTVAYMSPEQSAGLPVSPAADWYSVGVVLYQALTGRLPFDGRPLDVLADKQRFEPPAPREVAPDTPEDLNTLCVELLRRDPSARPGGRELLRRLGRSPGGPGRRARAPILPRRSLTLVGRERHLAALERRLRDRHRGQRRRGIPAWPIGFRQERVARAFCGPPYPERRGRRSGWPVLRAGIGALQGSR